MAKMVVFLGNPGLQYERTRHNAGRILCSHVIQECSWNNKFDGQFIKKADCIYLCPLTYMNESGISVQKAAAFFNIKPENILVVHDDLELKFSEVRVQKGGGLGGHNGLRSVKQHLGTDAFCRLRIGIGRPPEKMDVASFVLARFTPEEETQLEEIMNKASGLLEKFIFGEIQ